MVKVGDWCVDKYDAVVCDSTKTGKPFDESCVSDTNENNGPHRADPDESRNSLPKLITHEGLILNRAYHAYSKPGFYPTRFVTYYQAVAACANSGKELLSDSMWVTASLGTFDPGQNEGTKNTTCNPNSDWIRPNGRAGSLPAGSDSCISQWGIEDLVGNLYQWTGTRTSIPGNLAATENATPQYTLRISRVALGHNALEGRGFVGFRCMRPAE